MPLVPFFFCRSAQVLVYSEQNIGMSRNIESHHSGSTSSVSPKPPITLIKDIVIKIYIGTTITKNSNEAYHTKE